MDLSSAEDSSLENNSNKKLILSLPYLQGYNPAPKQSGLLTYNRDLACPGVTLLVTGGSAAALLLDMDGNVLHEWTVKEDTHIRRAHLFPNGDLLAILGEGILVKLDKNSKEIWRRKGSYHHDLEVEKNGDIYTLTETKRKIHIPEIHVKRSLSGDLIDNSITILSPEGNEKNSISIFDCIISSDYMSIFRDISLSAYNGDIFHTNTIALIKKGSSQHFPPFQEGFILVSFRNLHTIAIIDPNSRKVIWVCSGMWTNQHEPTILSNGNILLFDNLGEKGMSKVIEFNPSTQEIIWSYRGNKENGFRTQDLGSQQRLSNGNTLITESRDGRVFEVTPDNRIVWEYINPQRTGDGDSLVAAVYDAIRLDPDDLPFLEESDD